MSEVRRGLGRGLSALLGEAAREQPVQPEAARAAGVTTLPVAAIVPNPDQPRRRFDEAALDERDTSLGQRGLIQPFVVRPQGDFYPIVAGERRWRAAQRARLHEVPVIVRTLSDAETVELAIVENVQRQDLNAIEEAQAYRRLSEEYGHTQEALSRLVGKSRSHVANLLRLLDLPDAIRGLVASGQLSMGHARALVGADDPDALADEIVRRDLSVRDAEALARGAKPRRRRVAPIEFMGSDTDILMLERQLGDQLGLAVSIAHGPGGGSLTVSYATLDQLDMLCQRLSGDRP